MAALVSALHQKATYSSIIRLSSEWLVAFAPLPGSQTSEILRSSNFFFAEGEDIVEQTVQQNDHTSTQRLCALTERPENLKHLNGDFGFIRLREDGSLLVVRSCGGLVPFYIWQQGERAVVATRIVDLLNSGAVPSKMDRLVAASWACGSAINPDHRSLIQDVLVLPRGSHTTIHGGKRFRFTSYWQPRKEKLEPPAERVMREHAERLRSILLDHLERNLASEGGNLLSLSGGVDSSSLAALSAGVLRRPVSTVSLLPKNAGPEVKSGYYIDEISKRFRFDRQWRFELSAQDSVNLRRSAPLSVCPIAHPVLCLLPQLISQASIKVYFGGEFADQICGSKLTIFDWATGVTARELWRNRKSFPFGQYGVKSLFQYRAERFIGYTWMPFAKTLPSVIHSDVRREYREWRNRRLALARRDEASRPELAMRLELDGWLSMNWEVASTLGVRRCFPFVNREALELAFEIHPNELLGPGSKALLRRALAGDVPSINLGRPDKSNAAAGRWKDRLPWTAHLPTELAGIVRDNLWPRPPSEVDFATGLHLQLLLNIVAGLRNQSVLEPQ